MISDEGIIARYFSKLVTMIGEFALPKKKLCCSNKSFFAILRRKDFSDLEVQEMKREIEKDSPKQTTILAQQSLPCAIPK